MFSTASLDRAGVQDVGALLGGVRALVDASLPEIEARRGDICWKDDDSPVTEADIFLERRLADWLGERLPGLILIGEESYVDVPLIGHDDWAAVLDPIDGTEHIRTSRKTWGVSLRLWRGEQPFGSLLMLPELGEHLQTGQTLKRQRSRITGFSSSITPEIAAEIGTVGEARIMGCAVYNLYNVTRGALARFVNPKGARSWDLLAGLMLAREHGCAITVEGQEYDGSFLQPDRRYRVDIRHRYDLHPG